MRIALLSAIEPFISGLAGANIALHILHDIRHDFLAVRELVNGLVLDGGIDQIDQVQATAHIQRAPHDPGHVAEDGLEEEQKGHPLIVP